METEALPCWLRPPPLLRFHLSIWSGCSEIAQTLWLGHSRSDACLKVQHVKQSSRNSVSGRKCVNYSGFVSGGWWKLGKQTTYCIMGRTWWNGICRCNVQAVIMCSLIKFCVFPLSEHSDWGLSTAEANQSLKIGGSLPSSGRVPLSRIPNHRCHRWLLH